MAWPTYAGVAADGYVVRDGESVRRTQFEDGAARQARAFAAAYTVREIVAVLDSDEDLVRFRAWARAEAHTWFAWPDTEDGTLRRVRVVGGAGGIECRAVVTPGRKRHWRARLSLEGLWSDQA